MKVYDVIVELKNFKINTKKKKPSDMQKSYEVLGLNMRDIRKLAKSIGINHSLAIELYKSKIYEAMMLSTMIASKDLAHSDLLSNWAKNAESSNIVDQGLSKLVLQKNHYQVLLKEWCLETDEDLRYAGFTVLSLYFGSEDINKIDIDFSTKILSKITETIINEPLTIQNAMNNAVVMAGLHVPLLVDKATEVAEKIGYIMPTIAKNSCNIQSATDYLIRYKNNPKYSRVAKLNQNI